MVPSAEIPLLGKRGAWGGSVNFRIDLRGSAGMLIEPPLTPPLPRRGVAHFQFVQSPGMRKVCQRPLGGGRPPEAAGGQGLSPSVWKPINSIEGNSQQAVKYVGFRNCDVRPGNAGRAGKP